MNLSKKLAENVDELQLHRFLGALFSYQLLPEEKVEILTNEYGIVMTDDLERRINIMCNLSEAIEESGILLEKREIALEMLKAGEPHEKIRKYTKLSEEAIKALEEEACARC